MQKEWLKHWPWETVIAVNAGLCKAKDMGFARQAGYEQAHQLWEGARHENLSLAAALGICRECHRFAPFAFFNGNTFVAVGRTLIEDLVRSMPPDHAQIFRSIVGHYIAGTAGEDELASALAEAEESELKGNLVEVGK